MPWKGQPLARLRGTATLGDSPADGATIRVEGSTRVTAATDGSGYFGAVDLTPGAYTITLLVDGRVRASTTADLTAGNVFTAELSA
jgi:hypothetical protein